MSVSLVIQSENVMSVAGTIFEAPSGKGRGESEPNKTRTSLPSTKGNGRTGRAFPMEPSSAMSC
jgi:hypothetical protein